MFDKGNTPQMASASVRAPLETRDGSLWTSRISRAPSGSCRARQRAAARIRHGVSAACYVPDLDEVRLPTREAFRGEAEYYGTLFHELTHSTGHESRLARCGIVDRARFASHDYSEEELVAEMGSAYLGHVAGILPATLENSAAYLRSWVRVYSRKRACSLA